MKKVIISLIVFYQRFLSFKGGLLSIVALPGGTCKYEVSCSEYAIQMIEKYGLIKGILKGGRRILSCR